MWSLDEPGTRDRRDLHHVEAEHGEREHGPAAVEETARVVDAVPAQRLRTAATDASALLHLFCPQPPRMTSTFLDRLSCPALDGG
jgi:hypothetical protein